MTIGRRFALAAVGSLLALALASVPAGAAGFGIFEQGSRAMGMGGAFTAQADDPSALFFNAAGLAFADHQRWSLGATYITFAKADFQGRNPFPGDDVRAKQEKLNELPPHAYWIHPINDTWRIGVGLESPFGLRTSWQNPSSFAGRFLSTRAELRAVDLNPTLGWKLSQNIGLGIGAIFRFSDLSLRRDVPQIDPFTFEPVDVASVKLNGNQSTGIGWNLGILDKVNDSFSWGVSYRSKVKIDYKGDAHFHQNLTGNPVFDAIVASQVPFGQALPIETSIEFPDMASFGVHLMLTQHSGVELDANWTGWSSFHDVAITFPDNPQFSSTLSEEWKSAWNYRVGYHASLTNSDEFRAGLVYDRTPQPERHVSPLLPDADRMGYSLGWGHRFGSGPGLDLALMYLPFKKRTTTTNVDGFFGTYQTTAWLFGATLSF